jgi:archaellum component FlaC
MAIALIMLGTAVYIIIQTSRAYDFWKRSADRLAASIVADELNKMTDLESKIRAATRELNLVLQDAADRSSDLEDQTERFKDELADKRHALSRLTDEVSESKQRTLKDWQTQVETLQQKLASLETDFATQAESFQTRLQERVSALEATGTERHSSSWKRPSRRRRPYSSISPNCKPRRTRPSRAPSPI